MALSSQRFDRKVFLTWALGSTSAVALGCSDAGTDAPAGSGGASGGSAGAAGSSTFPSGGTFSNAGSGGTFTSSGAGGGGGMAGGGGGASPMPSCATQLKVTITSNHGHVLDIMQADVMAGATKVYDTKGTSNHEHWVQLTAVDFAKLRAGGTVRKLSCNDGHEHEYIVNCVGNDKPDTTSGVAGSCDTDHKCAGAMDMFCPELP